MGDQKDVFEMSEEEFQAAISDFGEVENEESHEEIDEDTNVFDSQEVDENTDETTEETDDQGTDTTDAFNFQGTDFSSGNETEQKVKIVHNGQEHYVTQDELINLAQKGYDYNQKTSKIAPHRRLIELIEEDEELKDKINQHVVGKYVPDVSKRDDYETEEEWLKDNLSKTVSKVSPFIDSGQEESQQGESTDQRQSANQQEPEIVTTLRNRDPQNFDTVVPYMKEAITNLSVKQYQDISNDPQKVVQFYDLVKTKLSEAQQNQSQSTGQNENPRKPKSKSFNLRSGQGTNTQPGPKEKNVWEMNNKDFNALRQKSLGF